MQAKFRREFNFNNYPQKSKIYHWLHKFQATRSVNNLKKKAENARSGRKFIARCPDNVDAVRDSVGRSPKTFPRTWSFTRIVRKNLKDYPERIPFFYPCLISGVWKMLTEFPARVYNHHHSKGVSEVWHLPLFGDETSILEPADIWSHSFLAIIPGQLWHTPTGAPSMDQTDLFKNYWC